jgi:hypothetical protein
MTDKILEFAKSVDEYAPYYDMQGVRYFTFYEDELEAFANLIRADEREQCAKICDENNASWTFEEWNKAVDSCAELIRARKDKP